MSNYWKPMQLVVGAERSYVFYLTYGSYSIRQIKDMYYS